MKQAKTTRRALLMSLLSLLLCCSMLVGTTFAWFTDSVTSGKNKIVAGNLDVELYHTSGTGTGSEEKVDGTTELFKGVLWEPGAVAFETFRVTNEGSLALKYQLALATENANTVVEANGTVTDRTLADVLKVAVVKDSTKYDTRDELIAALKTEMVTLKEYVSSNTVRTGKLLPKEVVPTAGMDGWASGEEIFTVVLYWEPNVLNDDDYNLKNGAKASDAGTGEVGELSIDFSVKLDATQVEYEQDSFGDDYDKGTFFPTYTAKTYTELREDLAKAEPGEIIAVTDDITISTDPLVPAAGVIIDGGGNVVTSSGNAKNGMALPAVGFLEWGAALGIPNEITTGVTFRNFVFEKGDAWATVIAGGGMTFENCTFESGSVYITLYPAAFAGGTTTFKNCTFKSASDLSISTEALNGKPEENIKIVVENCTFERDANVGADGKISFTGGLGVNFNSFSGFWSGVDSCVESVQIRNNVFNYVGTTELGDTPFIGCTFSGSPDEETIERLDGIFTGNTSNVENACYSLWISAENQPINPLT